MYSLIGGIFNVNVFLWSNVLEEVERTRVLPLTGVSANEIIHFSIYITQHLMQVCRFCLFLPKVFSDPPSIMNPHIGA